jgi:cytidylate kinase
MAVWTVSAEQGTGGDRVSANLAAAADVALIDRDALALLARDLNPDVTGGESIDELERSVGRGGISLLALGVPFSPIAAEMVRQMQLQHALPELGRAVTAQAARQPCVISAAGAFAAMPRHPAAVHVRLRAPLEWRVAQYAREHCVNHRCAEKAVRTDDHKKHAWLKSIYHIDIADPGHFALVLDVSRFSCDRIVETLLAAGGVDHPATAAIARSGIVAAG